MIVVTGATGHVGNNLVRKLLARNEKVRALIRQPEQRGSIEGLDIEKVYGDLLDYDSLVKTFTGAKVVYNCAAKISIMPGEYKSLYEVNVKGTENVINACLECSVERLVHVSSVEAIGDCADEDRVLDESYGFNPEKAMLEYGVTKAEGSIKVEEAVKDRNLNAVIVCPVGVIGPNDYRPSQMGKMIMDFANKKLPAYPGGGFDFVDVRDVCEGMILAAEKGRTGETYLLTGRHVKIPELMGMLSEITGIRKPFFQVPHPIIYASAFFAEKYYKIAKTEPVFTRDSIRILRSNLRVNCEKAKKELGFEPIKLEKSLEDQLECFKRQGALH